MRHLQRETVVDLSGRDPARLSFAAFYADCQHETRPVREGHRVALVFNLALRGAGAPVGAPDFSELEKQIAKVLRPWSESAKDGEKFVWLLEHDYSTSGLSFATLKGKDATVARTLAAAAARAGCSTHAAIACITEYGSGSSGWYGDDGEIEMDHVEDWECVLESWAAPDGTRPNYGRLPLEDGELLPNRALDDADPDEKRIEEASGNSGATIEHVYRNAALVPWPRARTLETLLTAGIAGAAEYGKALVRADAHEARGPSRRRALGARLTEAWPVAARRDWASRNSGESMRRMVSALAAIADPDLILRFFRMAAVKEDRGTENRELAAAVACAGAERMSTFLPHFILVNARKRPAGVLGLLARLGREVGRSGKREWRELLAAVAVAVLKGLRLSFRPPLHGRKSPSRKSLDATAGCNLFWLVNSFGTESQSATAVALVARHPARVAPERTVPQALVKMRERDGALVDAPAYEALWRHAASAVLRRSECAPEGPVGWYIEAYLACDCRGCVQLARFCRNSASKRTKIAVNQGERFHLRDKITTLGLDIDFETERRGRPFKLVCTKNRNSHKRRLEEYADDLATMKVLIDAVPTRDGRGLRAEELDRLRGATSSTE